MKHKPVTVDQWEHKPVAVDRWEHKPVAVDQWEHKPVAVDQWEVGEHTRLTITSEILRTVDKFIECHIFPGVAGVTERKLWQGWRAAITPTENQWLIII